VIQAPLLAFDIGGTNLRGALVDERGRVLADARAPSGGLSAEAVAREAGALARTLEQQTGLYAERVGAGVAAMLPEPGDVIENAPNLGWRDVPLRRLLSEALDHRPVRLFNDLDAIAFGEARFGAARGAKHVACVFVGTGVGAGLIIDGHLVRGFRGVAAELGHVKVVPEGGRACGCGAYGCLEAYTGGAALLERIGEAARRGENARVVALAGADLPTVSHVDAAAAEGDEWAVRLWSEVGTLLSVALANLVTVLNPEVLVLGGGVLANAPGLLARVREGVGRYTNAVALKGFELRLAELGDDAGLVGAAGLVR
jgi:glucokinase